MEEDKGPDRSGIAGSLKRLFDERSEPRAANGSQTAMLSLRGANHVVRVVDLSPSGAMIHFAGEAAEGDTVMLQLLDHGPVGGQVRWSRDGRIGVHFNWPIGEQGLN